MQRVAPTSEFSQIHSLIQPSDLVPVHYVPQMNHYYEPLSSTNQQTGYCEDNQSGDLKLMTSPLDPQLNAELYDRELWGKFSAAKTEMIVTKTGRRMFPGYRVKLSEMDPEANYCVIMDLVNVDQHRYKYQNGKWTIAGRGEPQIPQRFYLHPFSPASGQQWMKEIVSFHKVKLTNFCGNPTDGKFLIHSMHRYQPRIHVIRTDDVSTLHLQPASTFSFPQTVFITVTAYQNHEVTKLKVENNPFARGFRADGGKTKNATRRSSQVAHATKRSRDEAGKDEFCKRSRSDSDSSNHSSVTSQTSFPASYVYNGPPTPPSDIPCFFPAPVTSYATSCPAYDASSFAPLPYYNQTSFVPTYTGDVTYPTSSYVTQQLPYGPSSDVNPLVQCGGLFSHPLNGNFNYENTNASENSLPHQRLKMYESPVSSSSDDVYYPTSFTDDLSNGQTASFPQYNCYNPY